jgi:NCS1 family nucleobase:cation symporter-1
LTANVGFWATVALNIPDFTRYVKTQRDQVLGQALGLPLTMGLYSFIGVAVTSATVVIYGSAIWDPVELLSRFESPFWHGIGLFGLILATLATNLAANVVGPANDFANMAPRLISFRTGAVLTGLIGIGIQPWRLVADPSGYIFKWLVAYSALLGAIGGILIADYYLLRKMRFNLRGLYDPQGPYWYWNGFHIASMVALTAGIAPCIPGFLATIGVIRVSGFWFEIYHYAWFISFGISFAVYLMITLAGPAKTLPGRSLDRVGED